MELPTQTTGEKPERALAIPRAARAVLQSQQVGLVLVLIVIGAALTASAGSHANPATGATVNNFLNKYTLIQMATDASAFAIMGVGATIVIIAGAIDLSVGAIYAIAGVTMTMVLRAAGPLDPATTLLLGLGTCLTVGLACGLANGLMVVGLGVHSFIITLGTMWIFRGLAFVMSHAESILVPPALTAVAKASLGMGTALYPVPLLTMLLVTVLGSVYLARTVMGRHVFAVGGNPEASRFSGLNVPRINLGVFVVSGLTAGLAAFLGASFYGSASSSDGNGYELYVIAAAVVGGASLMGGKGSAINATLGAVLIVLIRQAIRTLHLDQNYEWIIIGVAMILAVVLDQGGTKLLARRLARTAGPANPRNSM
ncbi:MAG TPA: ABC transporter permease [Gemmatimonadaceae bacterium]|jgi:Ribose/xylose/arabinose/galactoside ABC-type transport systems, permease components